MSDGADSRLRSDPRWIAVVTQPQREKWAAENVARQGHRAWFPLCREQLIRDGQLVTVQRPLFPRYLFVRVSIQWRFLTGTFGVIGILLDGEAPAVVPDRVIDEIQKSAGRDGVVDVIPRKRLLPQAGDAVRIMQDGPLYGLTGTFVGMSGEQRCRVLLSMFGRQSMVAIGRAAVRMA